LDTNMPSRLNLGARQMMS